MNNTPELARDHLPLVSVCIPTYRGADTIRATLDSVLKQDYPNLEVWVIDDQSPDNTVNVVKSIDDPRVHYVRNERNLGPQGNWDRCLELANGKYYKLLPHDDLLEPGSLREQIDVLEADTTEDIALVFGSRRIIGPGGKELMVRGFSKKGALRIKAEHAARRCVRAGSNLLGEPGNGLVRMSLARKIGHYDAKYPYMVDLDFWFRALQFGDAYYTGTVSSSFRVVRGSWSVAIGQRQHGDFAGFIDKFLHVPELGLKRGDRSLGLLRARVNTYLRMLVYRFVL
ncbi:glycosyltransferase family 2 protein [Massilia yuzhufengensis]|uniref:Glycosyl transferase family 2 n=1 Tax=Massilia yuzhufengensis TaxID=1164594 RepID=A0A1I1DIZ0_9BURK|nr:glycosyltransferase [Massilia yuzhufengensis]SFB74406.1 Glycosyl transferase family 2 [Massilia yuzhufengensis]